ncbi:MAG: hypothetical protein QM706_17695 [Nitrospira sp.]
MTKLKMQVSNHILTEIPRFFGSFQSALRELFQNAWRAGAKTVIVSYDAESHTLIFSDDGPGCPPEKLLTAGESGWDNPEIIDPAGIGVFSLLRPEYIESVTYRSASWEMILTPEHLKGLPVEVVDLPNTNSGLTITLALQKNIIILEESIAAAMCFYPLDVYWMDGQAPSVKVKPIRHWASTLDITVPGVGRLEVDTWNNLLHRETIAVWQYIPIDSACTRKALEQAASRHPAAALLKAILHECDIRYFVNPAAGIRAKLPDRNELIHDEFLDRAADTLIAVLYDEFNGVLESSSAVLPDETDDKSYRLLDGLKEKEWVRRLVCKTRIWDEALLHMGYQKISYDDPEQYNAATMDEGDGPYLMIEIEQVTKYVRNHSVLCVSIPDIKTALNKQGVYAICSLNCDINTSVQVTGLRFSEKSVYLGFADKILVAGQELKWLVRISEHDWEIPNIDNHPNKPDELVIITSLTPEEFIRDAGNALWMGSIAYACDQEGTLWDNDFAEEHWGEYCIREDEIRAALETEAMSFLSSNLADARADQQTLINILNQQIDKAKHELNIAIHRAGNTNVSCADEINHSLDNALNAIEAATAILKTEIAALDEQFKLVKQNSEPDLG